MVEDLRIRAVEILQEQPALASLEILRRVREAGYQGGRTALYALMASLRSRQAQPKSYISRSHGIFPFTASPHTSQPEISSNSVRTIRRMTALSSKMKMPFGIGTIRDNIL